MGGCEIKILGLRYREESLRPGLPLPVLLWMFSSLNALLVQDRENAYTD